MTQVGENCSYIFSLIKWQIGEVQKTTELLLSKEKAVISTV